MKNNGCSRVIQELAAPLTIKVHVRMCRDLQNLVKIVSEIIPEIEAARPRASGMNALCLLRIGITNAESLLLRCSESSVLYLVLTGDVILHRFKEWRNIVLHSLSQIQNTVPLVLARKISGIILGVKSVVFCLDPPEQDAANMLRDLLQTYSTSLTEQYALSAIHAVCSLLQISSREALEIEMGLIERLIKKSSEKHQRKRKILVVFLRLLNRYMNATNKASFEGPPSLNAKTQDMVKSWETSISSIDVLAASIDYLNLH